MVHHTRNTEEKQWNETQVLALQGIVQVMPGNPFSRVRVSLPVPTT
jgi:hypothetical protein